MKILHCSDLHFDSPLNANLPPLKSEQRRQEIRVSFESMLDRARDLGVRAVLICGDLFDSRKAGLYEKNYLSAVFRKYPEITFCVLSGNHDRNIFDEGFERGGNVKVFGGVWDSVKIDGVSVSGIDIEATADFYDLPVQDSQYNIVMMHGDINGEIDLRRLSGRNIDYLALGHIHKYSVGTLDARGIYCYSGCAEARGFDETGAKGCVIIDTDKRTHEFLPLSKRIYHDITVDVSGLDEVEAKDKCVVMTESISKEDLVRIKITGCPRARINTDYILHSMEHGFFFLKVDDNTRLYARNAVGDISLQGEFVRLVNQSALSEEEKETIIRYGMDALEGALK